MNLEGGKSAKSGPGSQIGAVCRCEGEEKANHSFNICSKAPFGSQIQCCNKLRRIEGHQNIQEESTCLEGGKSAKSGPGSQIGAVCRCEGEEKAHHSHTPQSKTPFGFHIRCYNKLRRIGEHQNIQEESMDLEGGKGEKGQPFPHYTVKVPNLAQAAKSELFFSVTGIKRPTITSIYALRLHLGHKYNAATSLEELGSTKTYRRSQ